MFPSILGPGFLHFRGQLHPSKNHPVNFVVRGGYRSLIVGIIYTCGLHPPYADRYATVSEGHGFECHLNCDKVEVRASQSVS